VNLDIEGVRLLKKKQYSSKIEVDTTNATLEDVIDQIIKKNRIIDINIADIPLEEVIGFIYQKTKATDFSGSH
jgi:ABC-type uncharacterized transport system ATPase subunit